MSDAKTPENTGQGSLTPYWVLAALLSFALAIGAVLVSRISGSDTETTLEQWQGRLSIVATSRVRESSSWLNQLLRAVELLADDPSIQLFAADIAAGDPEGIAEGQRSYVYALLSAEAERSGFYEDRPTDRLSANVTRPHRMGIGVFTTGGQLLVGSSGLPAFKPELWQDARAGFIRLGPLLDDGVPLVLFGMPILAGEGAIGSDISTPLAPVGWVIGARPLDASFLETLNQPGDLSETGETYIVQRTETADSVQLLTPVRGGGRRLELRRDAAAAQAAERPGAFIQAPNYDGIAVLMTARDFSAPVDWVLVRAVALAEVNAAAERAQRDLITNISFAFVAILALLVLAWRLGSSARLERALAGQAELAAANQALSDFLTSVADGSPNAVAVIDQKMRIHFSNKRMATLAESDGDLIRERLDVQFDESAAGLLRAGAAGAATGEHTLFDVKLGHGNNTRTWRTEFLPLNVSRTDLKGPVLVTMNDITDLEDAHARSAGTLRNLVDTLTFVIDARDPWSRHHSRNVAKVAHAIGRTMGLGPVDIETLDIAALLVNLGKVFVPTSLLTKSDMLTSEELAQVHKAMDQGVALLSGMDFRGPVGPTLAQLRERFDGSGDPEGLAGEAILITARILTVANAFVAMVTPRAHRPTLGFDKAIDALNESAGKHYDRGVIAALVQIIENGGGREKWAHLTRPTGQDGDVSAPLADL